MARFVDQNFLLILVDGSHADASRHDNVRVLWRIADLENALARSELAAVDLGCQDR